MSKLIPLSNGGTALVDDGDYEWLSRWKWRQTRLGYAERSTWRVNSDGSYTAIKVKMHRVINNTPVGLDTDHINHIRLDNRRCNLRTVTHQENLHNKSLYRTNRSGEAGVVYNKRQDAWQARLQRNGVRRHLGTFKSKEAAIAAVRSAA